jgi:hypothetical protein
VLVSCSAGRALPVAPDRPAGAKLGRGPEQPVVRAPSAEPQAATDALLEQAASDRASARAHEQSFPLYGVAFHVNAQVFSDPSTRSAPLGHLRRGTTFRASEAQAGDGCRRWHALASGGFVCAGDGFAIGREPQSFEPSPLPPVLSDALPYRYAKNLKHVALQYWRIPTSVEQANAAKMVTDALALLPAPARSQAPPQPGVEATEPPPIPLPDYARMVMEPGFYVSVDREEADATDSERKFARTVRGAYAAADTLKDVQLLLSAPGVVLGSGQDLPLGIVYRSSAKTYRRDAASGAIVPVSALPKFGAIELTDDQVKHGDQWLRVSRSGLLVGDGHMRVVSRAVRPALVPRSARMIHVSLAQQTLVAYDGERPVFATLVSTGKEGYETPAGIYRIQHKNVTATMDGLAGSEDAYSIEDVPWTMYFHGSYALHGAFWHDRLGQTRSHGCVNLAPADARWLFFWVSPALPSGFHGVFSHKRDPGTFVVVE